MWGERGAGRVKGGGGGGGEGGGKRVRGVKRGWWGGSGKECG